MVSVMAHSVVPVQLICDIQTRNAIVDWTAITHTPSARSNHAWSRSVPTATSAASSPRRTRSTSRPRRTWGKGVTQRLSWSCRTWGKPVTVHPPGQRRGFVFVVFMPLIDRLVKIGTGNEREKRWGVDRRNDIGPDSNPCPLWVSSPNLVWATVCATVPPIAVLFLKNPTFVARNAWGQTLMSAIISMSNYAEREIGRIVVSFKMAEKDFAVWNRKHGQFAKEAILMFWSGLQNTPLRLCL